MLILKLIDETPVLVYNSQVVTANSLAMEAFYNVSLNGIAQILVQDNLLDKKSTLQYQEFALASKLSLLQYVVTNDIIPAKSIASSIAQHFRLPFIDLDHIDIASIPRERSPKSFN